MHRFCIALTMNNTMPVSLLQTRLDLVLIGMRLLVIIFIVHCFCNNQIYRMVWILAFCQSLLQISSWD